MNPGKQAPVTSSLPEHYRALSLYAILAAYFMSTVDFALGHLCALSFCSVQPVRPFSSLQILEEAGEFVVIPRAPHMCLTASGSVFAQHPSYLPTSPFSLRRLIWKNLTVFPFCPSLIPNPQLHLLKLQQEFRMDY